VTVPKKPSDAGIDPYLLLIDLERFDNVEEVEMILDQRTLAVLLGVCSSS
jgi:hypothetical protein